MNEKIKKEIKALKSHIRQDIRIMFENEKNCTDYVPSVDSLSRMIELLHRINSFEKIISGDIKTFF